MGWEDAMGSMGLGNIGSAYKRAALREQSDLEKDLYARGYRGVPTDQIDVKRGGLGSLLESAGILGAPEPQPMTEYQKYVYERGSRAKQVEDMALEASKLDLTNAKDQARFRTLTEAMKAFEDTQVPSPELLSNYPELSDDYEGFQIRSKKTDLEERRKRRLEENRAMLYNKWLWEGVRGGRGPAIPPEQAQTERHQTSFINYLKNSGGDRTVSRYFGDPDMPGDRGELGKAEKSGDPIIYRQKALEYMGERNAMIQRAESQLGIPRNVAEAILPPVDPDAMMRRSGMGATVPIENMDLRGRVTGSSQPPTEAPYSSPFEDQWKKLEDATGTYSGPSSTPAQAAAKSIGFGKAQGGLR